MIECVPNVSEGRRAEVIDACADAIRNTGVPLLDVSADPVHHRSVYTFAGGAGALEAAVLALFERAIALIDLRNHRGAHPRLGAVDVVPFVPLERATMAEAVSLARLVAAEVSRRHDLPVFLYEEAALRPERRRLETIRRGGFEGLAAKLQDPAWRPDFGPAVPHPTAGASAIGARWPLIAYNVNLRTTDLSVARAVAAAVRESSGGLPHVKALAVDLPDRGMVQVSMNLTSYPDTSLADLFDRVHLEAARRGADVATSEIVGLVPAAALPPDPASRLRLEGAVEDRILENRLRSRS